MPGALVALLKRRRTPAHYVVSSFDPRPLLDVRALGVDKICTNRPAELLAAAR